MLRKRKFIMLFCVYAAMFYGFSAEIPNLLKNADCSMLTPFKLPSGWEIRTGKPDGFTVKAGVITLDSAAGGKDVFLIQRNLPLASNGRYELAYSVKGSGSYRAYIEYASAGKMTSTGAVWQNISSNWSERNLEFTLKPEASQIKLVFHVRNGSRIDLRSLSLTKQETSAGKNLDFSRRNSDGTPLAWTIRGGKGAVTFKDREATLRKTTDETPFLIQRPLNTASAQKYRFTVDVMSKNNAQYRFYLEEITGKQRKAFGITTGQPAPAQWKTLMFEVPPAQANSIRQLVLSNPASGGEVSFRNLHITPVSAISAETARMLGAPVKLNGTSKSGKTLEGIPSVTAAYVSNYIPGAVVQGVKVTPGRHYELSYSVKGEGKASNTTGIMHFFDVRIDLKDGSELIRSTWDDVMSGRFVPKKFVFSVPEKHAGIIDIGLGVTAGSSVTFLLTGLKEKTITPAETARLVITSPIYQNGIYASKPVAEVAGFAEVKGGSGKAEFKVLRDGKTLASLSKQLIDGRAEFSFDSAIFPLGATQVDCRIYDAAGKELKHCKQTITRYPRSKGNEVVIGQDKQFYLNGKLYFPIVQYGMRPDDLPFSPQFDVDTVRYVSRGGSNVFLFTPKDEADALRILNLLAENNSMAMFNVGFWRGEATWENVNRWGHAVCSTILTPKVLEHPAFFGFYFADEPRWNGVPAINLQMCAETLRKITPYHPKHIVAAPRGSVEDHLPYAAAADFYGIDIYPVPAGSHSNLEDRTLTSVGKYARRADAMQEYRKPVLMTLQAFAWGELSKRKRIYPTLAESRFMAYDALLNGATHIAYYSLRHVIEPSFIDVINTVTLELHRMSRLLTSGKIVADRTENDIHYRVIEFVGKRYAIALNTKQAPREAVINAGFKNASVNVLEENRRIAVKNGMIAEKFPPFGVRVYAEAPLPPPLSTLPSDTFENPWKGYTEQKQNITFYQGKACWIWDKTVAGKALSSVYLSKEFELKKQVKSVRMLASADNMAQIWLNGREIAKVDEWEYMSKIDLTASIRQGRNVISVFASDGLAPPCAFLTDIRITYQDGTTEDILTDDSWYCSPVKVEDWKNPETVKKYFKKVDFVVPYGEGRWAHRMKL